MNHRPIFSLITLIGSLAAMPSAAVGEHPVSNGPIGLWVNPQGSARVKTAPCAEKLCGWVAWASPRAIADAAEAGTPQLVGLELLRDYHAAGPRIWRGTVFVPDMGRVFSSTITQLDSNRLKISGCILAGLICKSQVWHRG